jgi:integrase
MEEKRGDADATIRRQLGRLRSAFSHAKALDLVADNHIPTFALPKDSKPRTGFLDLPDFITLRQNFPEHLRSTLTFLYYSGCRTGAAKKITWAMVSKDCTEIELPAEIVKNKESLTIPLQDRLKKSLSRSGKCARSFPSQQVVCSISETFDGLGTRRVVNSDSGHSTLRPRSIPA